eukprot:2096400-Rhodomonas_salina.2
MGACAERGGGGAGAASAALAACRRRAQSARPDLPVFAFDSAVWKGAGIVPFWTARTVVTECVSGRQFHSEDMTRIRNKVVSLSLQATCAMFCTHVSTGCAMSLRVCYAMSGTDPAYDATRAPTYGASCGMCGYQPRYLPTRLLHNVRYRHSVGRSICLRARYAMSGTETGAGRRGARSRCTPVGSSRPEVLLPTVLRGT